MLSAGTAHEDHNTFKNKLTKTNKSLRWCHLKQYISVKKFKKSFPINDELEIIIIIIINTIHIKIKLLT